MLKALFSSRNRGNPPDTLFLATSGALIVIGLVIFFSAAFGLLARSGADFGGVIFSQVFLGLIGGCILAFILYRLDLAFIRRYSFHFFVLSFIATLLVFVPGIGFEWAGAKRWIILGPVSFQPAEFLKLMTIILGASWMAGVKDGIKTFKYGLAPLLGMIALVGGVLVAQPDNGTFLVVFATIVGMFIVAGGRIKHLLIIGLGALVLFAAIAFTKPYVMSRLTTFLNPNQDTLGQSYQIRQSLVAIGSGQVFGRGFGQSIQKFEYLPEPIGDSIFAILGEEFGFIGSALLIIILLFFALRGLRISARAPNSYSRLVVAGIIIMIISQSFLNIGAMLGVLPLTGIPLVFVSHGGSSLLFAIASLGLVLNVSRFQKTT